MAYVINEPCIGTKDASCVEVCPVDCIHPTGDEPGFEAADQLYIDPEECIDCDACVEACPVDAITSDDMVPPEWHEYIERNAAYYGGRARDLRRHLAEPTTARRPHRSRRWTAPGRSVPLAHRVDAPASLDRGRAGPLPDHARSGSRSACVTGSAPYPGPRTLDRAACTTRPCRVRHLPSPIYDSGQPRPAATSLVTPSTVRSRSRPFGR